ncbi:MAG: DNA primase [Rubrobacteraceae bacterium]
MKISQRSIEEIRESANIVEVASEFTALRRQGTSYTGLCPYPDHSEKTPSFSVTPEKGFYYCFGCQKGGDAIKLVTDLKSLPFVEAVTYLAERSGIELEFEGATDADSRAAAERSQRRRDIHKALAAAAIYYHKYLLKSKSEEANNARNYLKRRGFESSTIEEFRLGLAPPRGDSGFLVAAGRLGIGRKELDAAGLLSSRGGERFAGRVVFPISDRRGRIVGFGGRAMGDAQPKYLNSPETEVFNKRDLLYGFPQVMEPIRKARSALVVEGYTDVLMLYQSGIKNAVATLGTATTPGHLRTLSSYAESIYVLFDPDAAGEKAIERAAATASELKVDLRVLRLPQDPADWLLEHPADEFEELVAQAPTILEYGIRRIVERTRGSGATERSRAVPEVQNLVREVKDPVLHREALRIAGEALGVPPETLQEDPRPRANAPQNRNGGSRFNNPTEDARRQVLAFILARPDLTEKLLKTGVESPELPEPLFLIPEDFGEGDYARLFTVLRDHAGEDIGAVTADERSRDLMDGIGALHAEGEKLYPSTNSVKEAWLRLIILNRERAKRQTQDYDEKDRLHAEVQKLKAALRAITSQP